MKSIKYFYYSKNNNNAFQLKVYQYNNKLQNFGRIHLVDFKVTKIHFLD